MGVEIENILSGMVLVLLRGPRRTEVRVSGFMSSTVESCAPYEDKTHNGMPLRVLAVAAPYVAVEYVTAEGATGKTVVDTRCVELSVASEAYLEAFSLARSGKKSDPGTGRVYISSSGIRIV